MPLVRLRFIVLLGAAALAACSEPRLVAGVGGGACTSCHGDAGRGSAVALNDAAPPGGTRGGSLPTDADVGAHEVHLSGGRFSQGFACRECHALPGGGHPDGQIQLDFAAAQNRAPETTYDPASRTCASSYCHGGNATPAWNADPAAGPVSCGSCHGLPPASGHPAVAGGLGACAGCHPETVDSSGNILATGKHVNGVPDVAGAVHPAGWGSPSSGSFHGSAALAFLAQQAGAASCGACHGADLEGGSAGSCGACHAATASAHFPAGVSSWKANCTFCHGTPTEPFAYPADLARAAPPDDVSGRLTGTDTPAKVGAHRLHLAGGEVARGFACATCHPVPTPASPLDHLAGGVAEVTLSGADQGSLPADLGTYSREGGTCSTYCHAPSAGGGVPAWSGSLSACNACHGNARGSVPYPETGKHDKHVRGEGVKCANCHAGVVTDVPATSIPAIADRALHVDGKRDVAPGGGAAFIWNPAARSCTSVACHGDKSW